jgi:hypothetical protein
MAVSTGDQLGPYTIQDRLGVGGMGEVYRALDTRLGRTVAVKISAARFTERFEREARVVASLDHRNICTLLSLTGRVKTLAFRRRLSARARRIDFGDGISSGRAHRI